MKRAPLFVLMLLFSVASLAQEQEQSLTIREWQVPWEHTRPRDPDLGPKGDIWFVGQQGDYVARLDPESGEFSRMPLDKGSGPHNLIVASDGSIWYAGNRAAHIGRMNPQSGEIHKIPMPDGKPRDPHTLVFDDRGDIWFTAQAGNMVGKLETDSEQLALIDLHTSGARPYGIKVKGDTIWVALFGCNKLARIDATAMTLEEIDLPREQARPRRLDLGSDGSVWYGDYIGGKLGRYDPEAESFQEWDLPSGSESRPYALAVDRADRVWLVETGVQPNRLVGFDPKTERFFATTPIESGGGTVRHMVYDPAANVLWFGTDANTIGRADLPPGRPAAP